MKKTKKLICSHCGTHIHNEDYEYNDALYCEECYHELFITCDMCGEICPQEDSEYVDCDDYYVCRDCFESEYFQCDNCGQYYRNDDSYEVTRPSMYICEGCRYGYNGDTFYTCDDCGDIIREDYAHTHGDYCYCDDCYEENHNHYLYDYHEFDEWQFFKSHNEIEKNVRPREYYGREIELEPLNDSDIEGVLDIINTHINAVGMEDGSLNCGGVEVVTHPETWEYMQEHKQNYINFFNKIKDIDYGNNGHTGLHFHVTRPASDEIISRIIVILESFKDEIKKLSRRRDNQIDHWSRFLTDTCSDENRLKFQSKKYLEEEYCKCGHDRYVALNLNNSHTIEFRFFNGVNNFIEYWGSLQFIHNIMDIAYDVSKDLDTIKWKDLIVGDELVELAKEERVYEIDKNAKDTTEIYEKFETIKQETKEKILKTLSNMIKYINREMSKKTFENLKSSDVNKIYENTRKAFNDIDAELSYISNLVYVYNNLKDNLSSISETKRSLRNSKQDKYRRYFNQLDKIFKNYESEVYA